MRVCVVVPAYNESESIDRVVEEIRKQYHLDVLVIDDCSTDSTAKVAASSGALVYTMDGNQGYNSALYFGIWRAKSLGYTHVITMDGDGQHPTSAIKEFLFYFGMGVKLVVAKRARCARWAEKLFANYTNWKFGLRDPLCGMKGYELSEIGNIDDTITYDSVGTELLMRIVNSSKGVWREVEIKEEPRASASRFGDGLKPNFLIVRALLKGMSLRHPTA